MKKFLLVLSIAFSVGFATAVVAVAGLVDGSGTSPSKGLPYGSYRVSPLVLRPAPPPPPPPPPSQAWPPGNTPRLLRGGEVDNTTDGTNPAVPQPENK